MGENWSMRLGACFGSQGTCILCSESFSSLILESLENYLNARDKSFATWLTGPVKSVSCAMFWSLSSSAKETVWWVLGQQEQNHAVTFSCRSYEQPKFSVWNHVRDSFPNGFMEKTFDQIRFSWTLRVLSRVVATKDHGVLTLSFTDNYQATKTIDCLKAGLTYWT